MKKVDVVIGAAYGDEGKGQTVYNLATPDSVVVRFNGGAQAGHTAEHEGVRHVHSHFGAGTMKGCPTYLSKFFVCHPIMFKDEWEELLPKTKTDPAVFVSPECLVTTPYDVVLNILGEKKRGHGTCGVGFGETIERSLRLTRTRLTVAHFSQTEILRDTLLAIRDEWVPARCKELELFDEDLGDFRNVLKDIATIDRFIEDGMFFRGNTDLCWDDHLAELGDHFVFEGAQGLLLDEEYGCFPHVTRSDCGLCNPVQLLSMKGFEEVEKRIHYVTRAYTTRHGAGPLPHELPEKPYEDIVDETNITNEHQGRLRFSHLNLDPVLSAIEDDLIRHGGWKFYGEVLLRVTCLDQLPERVVVIQNEMNIEMPREELPMYCWHELQDAMGVKLSDVKKFAQGKRNLKNFPGIQVADGDPDQEISVEPSKDKRIVMLEDANRRANLAIGDQAEELGGIIEKQKQWIDDLQSGMYINCVYCGHRYGPSDEVPASMADVLKEHVEQCPKHPMSKLKTEVAALKAGSVEMYNMGYHAGHEDTVEARFTVIHHTDMRSFHADVVAEILDERRKPVGEDEAKESGE